MFGYLQCFPGPTHAAVTTVLDDLAAVTDQLIATVRHAAAADAVRMPVAGGILHATSRLTAAAVEALAAVTHRGVIADEGLTIGSWLRSFAGCTIADERTLDLTANRLADMPTLRRWFGDGAVSWPVIRAVVHAVRNLTKAQRQWVDATLAGDQQRVRRLGPDELVAAVNKLADQARPDLHRQREHRSFDREFLRMQLGFDGSSSGTFALNAEDTQTPTNALRDIHPDTGTTNHTGGDSDNLAAATATTAPPTPTTPGTTPAGLGGETSGADAAIAPTSAPSWRCASSGWAWPAAAPRQPATPPCSSSPTSPP